MPFRLKVNIWDTRNTGSYNLIDSFQLTFLISYIFNKKLKIYWDFRSCDKTYYLENEL